MDQSKSLVGDTVFVMKFLLQEIMDLRCFPSVNTLTFFLDSLDQSQFYPSMSYEEIVNGNLPMESDSSNYLSPVSWNKSSLWRTSSDSTLSTAQQVFNETLAIINFSQEFINQTAQMDRFFNALYSVPYFQGYIQRVCIYYWEEIPVKNPNLTMVRLFPGEQISSPKYSLLGSNALNGFIEFCLL